MAMQPNELPSAKNPAQIYSTDATPRTTNTDTPEPQTYAAETEESLQGESFTMIFLAISAVIILALILWRVALVMGVL